MAEGDGEGQTTGARSATLDVFISYASQDAALADSVVAALERQGLKCWIAPRDVTPGEFYADAIVRAINEAMILVLVLTENAVTSPHVLREVERSSAKRHAIVSLRLTVVSLPPALEYFLSASHWLDASSSSIDSAIPKLVEAVKHLVAPPSGGDPGRTNHIAKRPADLFPHPPSTKSGRAPYRSVIALSAVIALGFAYFAFDKLWLSKRTTSERPIAAMMPAAPPAPAISEKSVAVLPFIDMSEKKNQEYFSDGLSEELIDHLAHTPDLKVIARTSSFQFKGKNEDMRTIGQKLGVANLLEGSVRTSGNTLRVTAQLIKVSDGSHLWSETYDRDVGDIFKVQDSIAAAVVTALQATIAKYTSSSQDANTEAYNAALRGEYLHNKRTKQDSEHALAAYQEAIRLDPRYAIAWVGIAEVYNDRGVFGWMPQKTAYIKAREAIDHALSIDPNLAIIHRTLANLEWNYLFDLAAARTEISRTRELDPVEAARVNLIGWDALISGKVDEGIRYFQQAIQRDPLNAGRLSDLSFLLQSAGQLAEAEGAGRSLLDLNPTFADAHCNLGQVLLDEHKFNDALAIMSEEADADLRWCIGDALWALGRHAEADAQLSAATVKYADTQAMNFAESYARRNDKEEAFKWLNRAYDNRDPGITLMRVDPMLRNLRGDPRFTVLLRKLKLPE